MNHGVPCRVYNQVQALFSGENIFLLQSRWLWSQFPFQAPGTLDSMFLMWKCGSLGWTDKRSLSGFLCTGALVIVFFNPLMTNSRTGMHADLLMLLPRSCITIDWSRTNCDLGVFVKLVKRLANRSLKNN